MQRSRKTNAGECDTLRTRHLNPTPNKLLKTSIVPQRKMFQTLSKAAKPCRAVRQPFLNSSFFRSFSTADATQQEESPPTVSVDTNSEEDEEQAQGPVDLMKPSVIVAQLERHIVGQTDAKRAVAISLRNRWRRQQIHESIRSEITPKNILMVGPTGCGKTTTLRLV